MEQVSLQQKILNQEYLIGVYNNLMENFLLLAENSSILDVDLLHSIKFNKQMDEHDEFNNLLNNFELKNEYSEQLYTFCSDKLNEFKTEFQRLSKLYSINVKSMHSYWCDEEKVLEIIKEFVSTFQIYKFEFESTIKEIHTNFYNVVNSTNFKPIDTTYSKIVLKLSDKVINFCHDGTKCYFDNDKKSTVNTISNNKNNISSNEKKTNEFEEIKQQFIKNNQQNDDLLI